MKGETIEQTIFTLLDLTGEYSNSVIDENVVLDFSKTEFTFPSFTKLKLENMTFNKNVTLINFSYKHIEAFEFINCVFKSDLYITLWDCQSVRLETCQTQKLIYKHNKVHYLRIENGEDGKIEWIDFNAEDTEYFRLVSKNWIKNINLVEGQNIDIYSPIENIVVFGDSYKDLVIGSELFTEPNEIRSLKIARVEFEGFITLQSANINFLDLDSIKTGNGTLILNELSIDNFAMEDCHIQNIQFSIVNFKKECSIIRSNIEGIKLFNVSWLDDRKFTPNYMTLSIPWLHRIRRKKIYFEEELFIASDLNDLRYQRDAYRQLKGASIKNHNQIHALAFYKNEMRLYWKEIRIAGGENWWDQILIWVDKSVSNFGQSYARPFFLLLFFQFIVCFFIWGFEAKSFSYLGQSSFSEGAKQYANWLIPIYEAPEVWGTGASIVGVVGRVLSGFFIFHFIKATRKFGKV